MTAPHPARFSDELMPEFQMLVHVYSDLYGVESPVVLDPFAGTGRIHELKDCTTIGVEIEPEWASMHPRTVLGDATKLPELWTGHFDMVLTSPTYGNRMADHHEARDDSTRITYRHKLGRPLHERNTGAMQWGDKYRLMHKQAWAEAFRVLRPGGWFVLNVRDHFRKGALIQVSDWHVGVLTGLGFRVINTIYVRTPGMRFGANSQRVDGEYVITFKKPNPTGEPK